MDIEKLLAQRASKIDKIIEKYIPRKYDTGKMNLALGRPRYAHDPETANAAIARPVWELLDRGGKRWRPVLFSIVCEALGGDSRKYGDLVVLFEIIHSGSLVCDDIEDNSDLRRGKPCLHKIFGIDIAVNVGSAMYYLPLLVLLRNKDLYKDKLLDIYEAYSEELIKIHFGQAMDIAWHNGLANADDISEKEYLQMCAYKTGTLARLAAKVGAIAAGADKKTIENIGALAEAMGIGFQIRDDILNLTAKSGRNQFTKNYIGSDISEGKRTLVVIHALSKAGKNDRNRLVQILGSHTKDAGKMNEAIRIMEKYDSVSYAKRFARELVLDAWAAAKPSLKNNSASRELEAFVKFAFERGY
jgi:geranylgeranyl pyrophosphate synthase